MIITQRFFKGLLVVAALAAAQALAQDSPASQVYLPSAIWEWQENVITDPTAQAAFFTFAATHGINRVYIECESAIQNNQPALIGFLEAAAGNGLSTELLFGDARWVLPGSGYPYQGYAVSLVSTYTAQLLSQMTAGKPGAVHFDVEPYSLRLWRTEQNTIALDYISLVTQLEAAARQLGMKLSVDVPYWYSTIPVTQGAATTPMNQLVLNIVDRYVIMDYWDTASRIERQATTDLTYANSVAGKQVVIGVLTTCNQFPADTSFCNTGTHQGTAWMETVLSMIHKAENPNPSFAGFAIEDYAGFSILGP
ncbi:MAG TPA: hypothetical protein VKR61_23435 [Bryobacteraceae bacterium]|nr:hypothetical protein [Bryobacteraceae bacterium]